MGKLRYYCMEPGVEGTSCRLCGKPVLAPDANGTALKPGHVLMRGRITVGRKLGNGGFGVTYVAYDKELKRRVALKEFMPEYLATRNGPVITPKPDQVKNYEHSLNSFLKEARALYELRRHPHIVHVHGTFKENNTAYYTMEMLDGGDLRSYIKEHGKLSGDAAFRLLYPIMDAMSYMHKKNILHRDISPDNIFLCKNPQNPNKLYPKLIDFGAAHVAIEGYSRSYPGVKKNGFSPLEQNWAGNAQGPWTDVYAFCATFYCAICGKVPMPAEDRAAGVDGLIPPSRNGASISPKMEEILMKGLSLQYANRIQSMDQLIAMFRECVTDASDGKTIMKVDAPTQAAVARPTMKRVASWILEFVLVAIAAAILYFGLSRKLIFNLRNLKSWIWLMPIPIMFVLDFLLLLIGNGTLGQLLMGIRVRSEDGISRASVGSKLLYALFYLTPIQIVSGLAWIASGKDMSFLDTLLSITITGSGENNPLNMSAGSGVMVSVYQNPSTGQRSVSVPHSQTPPRPAAPVPPVPPIPPVKPVQVASGASRVVSA